MCGGAAAKCVVCHNAVGVGSPPAASRWRRSALQDFLSYPAYYASSVEILFYLL